MSAVQVAATPPAVPGAPQGTSAVASLPQGGFAVAWVSKGQVYLRVYDGQGNPTIGEIEVTAGSPGGNHLLQLHPEGDGFVLTFTGPDPANGFAPAVLTHTFSSDGVPAAPSVDLAPSLLFGASSFDGFDFAALAEAQQPPTLDNSRLFILEGFDTLIGWWDLKASDADNAPADLVFTITQATQHGVMIRDETALGVGDTFTQADIDNFLLFYAHDGSETTFDKLVFELSDGAGGLLAEQSFDITILPLNDPPSLANTGLTLNEGATATIVPAMLDADDPDNSDAELTYTILTLVTHGVLRLDGAALAVGDSFTQDDINNGRLSYTHDGSSATSDAFAFTLTDGVEEEVPSLTAIESESPEGGIHGTFVITVVPVDAIDINEAPVNTVPATLELEANVPAVIAGLFVADDAGQGIITTTLSVQYGILSASAEGGPAIAGNGTDTLTLTGTLGQINSVLAESGVTYAGPEDFFGTDTLTMHTNDHGNTGSGGPLTDTDQVTLHLNTYLEGTNGNDSFEALPGNSFIVARPGFDTITFDFALVDAKVTYRNNLVIIDGPSSHTVLTGFEDYAFSDGTVHNDDGDRLVDDLYYYSRYHDVWKAGTDADAHYHGAGWREGRDPNAFFDTDLYLATNPDVKSSGADPLAHFDQFGWRENRIPSAAFDPARYLGFYQDVAAANRDPLEHFLRHGAEENRLIFAASTPLATNGFDFAYYLLHNPDVVASGIDPLLHFETIGWKEGRKPNALFDVEGYLANYADVAAAGSNPLDHYHQSGWREGRDPSVDFDTSAYLAAYPDVVAANRDPLAHYLQFGIHENRFTFADGVWG